MKLSRGARELTQYKNPVLIIASTHELLRHEVHAVVKAADVTNISRSIESVDVGGLVVCLEEPDGHVRCRTKRSVRRQ